MSRWKLTSRKQKQEQNNTTKNKKKQKTREFIRMLVVFFWSLGISLASENLCLFKNSYIMEKLASFQFLLIYRKVGPNSMDVYRWWVHITAYPNLGGFICISICNASGDYFDFTVQSCKKCSFYVFLSYLLTPPSLLKIQYTLPWALIPGFQNIYIIILFLLYHKKHSFLRVLLLLTETGEVFGFPLLFKI